MTLRPRSGEMRKTLVECRTTLGEVLNSEHSRTYRWSRPVAEVLEGQASDRTGLGHEPWSSQPLSCRALASPPESSPGRRQIRGKKVGEALNLLAFSSKKAAEIMKKVLESAVANAEHNEGADVDDLKVSTVFVNEGRSLKRIMPRAKGRADRIVKRSCHITVKVADK
ncbi:hypothetical protein SSTU70S_03525 [Stutzerimonas stutzeri]